jgi:HSP20 family protein
MKELSIELYRRSGWQPRADVYRCADGLLVKLELAGIAEQDLKISLHKDMLVVEGKRHDWCVSDIEASLSMEITYDWFRRVITLPGPVVLDAIRTEYHDGMLLVYLTIEKGSA